MPNTDVPLTLFQLLARAGVPFVIIGGHAVIFHGHVRATEDADVIFERSRASEAALLEALESIHACWISDQPRCHWPRKADPVSPSYERGATYDADDRSWFSRPLRSSPGFRICRYDVFSDNIELDNLRFVSLACSAN